MTGERGNAPDYGKFVNDSTRYAVDHPNRDTSAPPRHPPWARPGQNRFVYTAFAAARRSSVRYRDEASSWSIQLCV